MRGRRTVFLVGFMACGKSTVGKLLAQGLGLPFLDTDDIIERRAGMPVRDIFAALGERRFREMERELLAEISIACAAGADAAEVRVDRTPEGPVPAAPDLAEAVGSGCVVAAGGGLPCSEDNLARMKGTGTVVYLRVGVDDVLARVGDGTDRPLIGTLRKRGDLRSALGALLEERERFYLRADLVVDNGGGGPARAAAAILDALGNVPRRPRD